MRKSCCFIVCMFLLLLIGCGGGSQAPTESVVTRSSAANFSQDALAMAVRETSDAWVRADTAKQRDSDLKRIRDQFPILREISAWSDIEMHELWVSVYQRAEWLSNWEAGQLNTGNTELDSLLRVYDVSAIRKLPVFQDKYSTFVLTIEHPVNMINVAAQFQYASPDIYDVSANEVISYGGIDDIRFEQGKGIRIYKFKRVWDALTLGPGTGLGHDRFHFWDVSLFADGKITVEERGDPLPSGSGDH